MPGDIAFTTPRGDEVRMVPSQANHEEYVVGLFSMDRRLVEQLVVFLKEEYDAEFTEPVRSWDERWCVTGRVGWRG